MYPVVQSPALGRLADEGLFGSVGPGSKEGLALKTVGGSAGRDGDGEDLFWVVSASSWASRIATCASSLIVFSEGVGHESIVLSGLEARQCIAIGNGIEDLNLQVHERSGTHV